MSHALEAGLSLVPGAEMWSSECVCDWTQVQLECPWPWDQEDFAQSTHLLCASQFYICDMNGLYLWGFFSSKNDRLTF